MTKKRNNKSRSTARFNANELERVSGRIVSSYEAFADQDPIIFAYADEVLFAREYLQAASDESKANNAYSKALVSREETIDELRSLIQRWTRLLAIKRPAMSLDSFIGLDSPPRALAAGHKLIDEAQGEEPFLEELRQSVGVALEAAQQSVHEVERSVAIVTELADRRRKHALHIERFLASYRAALAAVIGKTHRVVRGLALSSKSKPVAETQDTEPIASGGEEVLDDTSEAVSIAAA